MPFHWFLIKKKYVYNSADAKFNWPEGVTKNDINHVR